MIPDWKIERFLTGDLPEEEMKRIQNLEATDEIFAQRIKMLREDNRAILNKLPFETLSEKLERAKVGSNQKTLDFSLVKLASAAVLVLAVALVALMSQRETVVAGTEMAQANGGAPAQVALVETQSDTRIKGMEARMEVWKKTSAGIVQMNNLDEAREGDEIQLRFSVPEKCFGLLFSMDGNGALTMHMGDGAKAIELAPGKMNSLPFAYKLDNAPHFEKFFLVTSQKEFAVDEKDIDKLLKNNDVKVISVTLKKVGE